MKGRGYLRDRRHTYTLYGAVWWHLGGSGAPPDAADLRSYAPPVKDQGQTESCTGHGTSGAVSTALRCAGTPLPWEPSECGLYTVGRCIDRVPLWTGMLPGLEDAGAQPSQVARGAELWGVWPSKAPAPDGRNSDCDPVTINREPTLGGLSTGALFPVVGSYALVGSTSSLVDQLRSALAGGIPVGCGFYADSAFENLGPGAPVVGAPNQGDPNGGGHWTYLLGYRTRSGGGTECLLRNSWGTGWGNGGDVWVDESFLGAAWQLIGYSVRLGAGS